MRLSLKDLFWSVTFASVGMGALVLYFSRKLEQGEPGGTILYILIPLLLMPGVLFGAAIGKLTHEPEICIAVGLAVEFIVVILALIAK